MIKQKILPVIMCGGTGSRLWPLSRASFPKQFLELDFGDSTTFLQNTINRFKKNPNFEDPLFICNEEHRFIVAEQIRKINIKASGILLEPLSRNTAPAITVASLKAKEIFKDPVILVLPSDHLIKDLETFLEVIYKGIIYAENGKIVTFGIKPDKPETGYGYIESKNGLDSKNIKGEEILSFIEKPNIEKAEYLISQNRFNWNSGMFLFKAADMLEEIKVKAPEILKLCKESLKGENYDLDFQRLSEESFSRCPNISIDKAIMEKTSLGIVLPLNVGWSDVGSWQSMWEVGRKDKKNNVIYGDIVSENVKDSYLRSEKRLIVGIGFEDMVVVDTDDALLVARRNQTQKVKDIVRYLESNNKSEANLHKTIFRPWGFFTSVLEEVRWKVKVIQVKPGEKLSLQMHHHRSEHWIVVKGTAKVEIDNKDMILSENKSCYIPLGSKHRLSNPGKIPLKLIEIQSGTYVGEDDIERFEDNYGRIKE